MITQGKWEVGLPKNPDMRQIEDRLIYVKVGDEKLHIAEVFQYQNHDNRKADGTAIDNARLIAAAPELLEACRDVRLELDFMLNLAKQEANEDFRKIKIDTVTARIKQVDEAIAKAKPKKKPKKKLPKFKDIIGLYAE